MNPKLLFGTNNLHKLREIKEIVGDAYTLFSLADLGIDLEVEETENTLEGNAILKAKTYGELAAMPCFADDTGLEVDALNGAPGVYSARYAGEGCSFEDNVQKLLRELQGEDKRTARFRTVIAYYDGREVHCFEGKVEGSILQSPRGRGGFGYDPVFLPEGASLTFAEMEPAAKNAISHRGRALKAFAHFLFNHSPH